MAHIGCIGSDGEWLREILAGEGVDCTALSTSQEATGHAIIQVVPSGENAIVLYAGANAAVCEAEVARALEASHSGDWFLCQNETSCIAASLRTARKLGLRTAYNAAPANSSLSLTCLADVDFLFVNETEASALGGHEDARIAVAQLHGIHPSLTIILTLGAEGAMWIGSTMSLQIPAFACEAIDTTAAGDTFTGYCLAALLRGTPPPEALTQACRAASLCVSRHGAASSIPHISEVLK